MKCPYCGKEMKAGKLMVDRFFQWSPDNRDSGFVSWSITMRSVLVPHRDSWASTSHTQEITANHCPTCQKFIFNGKLNE